MTGSTENTGTEGSARSGWKTARRLAWAAVAAAAIGAGSLVFWAGRNAPETDATGGSAVAIGGPFQLTDQRGRTVTHETLKGKPFAIFFGFTRCPDICPTTLNDLSQLRKQLGGDADKLNLVFVSLDPAHDKPQDIGAYLTLFDTPIIGLTGTDAQLKQIVDAYGVYYRRVPLEDSNDYTIDHTATVFLMGADGQFISAIDMHEPRKVALEKLRRLIRS